MCDARTKRRVSIWFAFIITLQSLAATDNAIWPVHTAVAQGVPRREPGGGKPNGFQQFDPRKFLEPFFGKETEAQKRKLAAIEIPWKEEKEFGDRVLEMFWTKLRRQGIEVIRRGKEVRYLQSLVAQVEPQLRHAERYRKFKVLLADTPIADARCCPGGTLVIFRGMLDAVQSEAALVCVLGHEMSHVDHGHQLRHLKSLALAERTFQPRRAPDLSRMMDNGMLVAQCFARPFRPEHEREADEDGVTWAYRLGYDPLEFANLFLRWERRDERRGEAEWKKTIPAFLRSHPNHRDRYEAVVARVHRLRRSEPKAELYVGRTNLLRRVPRSEREYEE